MHISLRADVQAELIVLQASEGRDLNDILAEAVERYKSRNRSPIFEKSAYQETVYTGMQQPSDDIDQYFGLWAKSGQSVDGLKYQDRMRSEW